MNPEFLHADLRQKQTLHEKLSVTDSSDRLAEHADSGTSLRKSFEAEVQAMEQRLITDGSIELTSGLDSIETARDILPAGMPVFVPSLPRQPILENLATLKALKAYGFDPVPHVAARRLEDRTELQQFLGVAVREAAVKTVLLIGGDVEIQKGPYASAEEVLRTGMLQDAGIATVGIAAYPEPHPRIGKPVLDHSLAAKIDLMRRTGLKAFVVTQFSLDPAKPVMLCRHLAQLFPELPVFVGVPGPTSVTRLLKYASFCGVGASLRALKTMGLKAARLGDRAASDQQIHAIAKYCSEHSESTVRGVHLFSFGGFRESVEWMRETARIGRP